MQKQHRQIHTQQSVIEEQQKLIHTRQAEPKAQAAQVAPRDPRPRRLRRGHRSGPLLSPAFRRISSGSAPSLIAGRVPVTEHGLAIGGYSGVYDCTPDHEPVLGAIPEYVGLLADFGWSGHGFKHAPMQKPKPLPVVRSRLTFWMPELRPFW